MHVPKYRVFPYISLQLATYHFIFCITICIGLFLCVFAFISFLLYICTDKIGWGNELNKWCGISILFLNLKYFHSFLKSTHSNARKEHRSQGLDGCPNHILTPIIFCMPSLNFSNLLPIFNAAHSIQMWHFFLAVTLSLKP